MARTIPLRSPREVKHGTWWEAATAITSADEQKEGHLHRTWPTRRTGAPAHTSRCPRRLQTLGSAILLCCLAAPVVLLRLLPVVFLVARQLPPIECPGEIGWRKPGKSLHGCPLPDRTHVGLAGSQHRSDFLGLFASLELLPYLVC